MDVSPFPYQGPLEPEQVHGRDDLVHDLVERVTERRVTALLGPRRFGKTSVLRRVSADLAEVTTLWVDLYEVTSAADVAVRFDDALGRTGGQFAADSRAIAATLSMNLGLLKVELTKPPRRRPDPMLAFRNLLDVLVRTAEQHATLLVIDEFSSIDEVEGTAGALRTALQYHYQELGIVFAGSQPSTMRALFTHRPEPFYGQADIVEIPPLSAAAVEEIVGRGFAETGRDAGHIAGLLFEFTKGHPQRTMQIADACWRRTEPGTTAGAVEWAAGVDDVRRSVGSSMDRLYSQFNQGEKSALRAVAQSGSLFGARADLLDLAKGSATHARETLIDSGDMAVTADGLVLVDPLFADWLRERFPI